MSTQITTAFVQQYRSNLMILAQQVGSRLRSTVRSESITGTSAYFDRLGATAAVLRTTRHGDTPLVDSPHSRRRVSTAPYEWADLIDQADKVRLLIEPTSDYARNAANAMGRTMDDLIIAAASGTAYTGVDGSGTQAITLQVAAGATNLTLAKLLEAKQDLDEGEVDYEDRFIIVSPKMLTSLLGTTEVKSADYNSVKALVQGQLDTFLGFKFITSNRLAANATADGHLCLAYQRQGLVLAVGEDIKTEIGPRADKSYSTQVFVRMDMGATRLEEARVVELDCVGG
jgi:hypothetical protein